MRTPGVAGVPCVAADRSRRAVDERGRADRPLRGIHRAGRVASNPRYLRPHDTTIASTYANDGCTLRRPTVTWRGVPTGDLESVAWWRPNGATRMLRYPRASASCLVLPRESGAMAVAVGGGNLRGVRGRMPPGARASCRRWWRCSSDRRRRVHRRVRRSGRRRRHSTPMATFPDASG